MPADVDIDWTLRVYYLLVRAAAEEADPVDVDLDKAADRVIATLLRDVAG